jgi:NAD(P)H dehydrogenase (quinone)
VKNLQILIIYDSKTGHTEKMAALIAEGAGECEGIEVIVKKVEATTNEDLLQAHGIIVGSPTYYGLMSGSIKAMFDDSVKIHRKLAGKVGAAFTSSGGVASGAETTILSILEAMLIHGMVVQGRARTEHYGAAVVGEPQAGDEERCREFGRTVAQLVLKLKP